MKKFLLITLAALTIFAACNEDEPIAPSAVSVSPSTLTLTEGETGNFTATVLPDGAEYDAIKWTCSDGMVASISSNGTVTALSAGTATINATTSGLTGTATITVKAKIIAVESVSIDNAAVTLTEGETVTLHEYVAPENASDKSVTWSSSDQGVATVDANGKVTAVKAGKANVTVTTTDGGKTATCEITVKAKIVNVTGVTLDKTEISLVEGNSETLTATVSPSNATNKDVTWTSSSTSVATVDSNGKVTAVKAGTATITVKTSDGSKTATCKVTVTAKSVAVTGVTLNKTTLSLVEGSTETLTATISPSNATNKNVTWTSSSTSVATVDANGKVTAVKAGTATITVKTADGSKTATCKVTVTAKTVSVTGVTLNKSTLTLVEGASETLNATISPSTATNQNVTWSTSNSSIATVSNGKVTAVKAGTATITVKTADGGKTATCKVTVTAKTVAVTEISLNKTSLSLTVGATETLIATISPSNATNKKVTWGSTEVDVATVDQNGKVTAVAPGKTAIWVKTEDGGKVISCAVTVTAKTVSVTGVTLNKTTLSLVEGASETLTATVSPSDATNKNVTWSSSSTSVASVNANGKVTAVKAGTATITVKTADGSKTATCKVTVTAKSVAVQSISLNKTSIMFKKDPDYPGTYTTYLKATINPENATNQNIIWKSSNTSVASVTLDDSVKQGTLVMKITGLKEGTATITATSEDGSKTATCVVVVTIPIKSVTYSRSTSMTIYEDGSGGKVDHYRINATVTPSDFSGKIYWQCEGEVAEYDRSAKGTVFTFYGKKAGTGTIYAYYQNDGDSNVTYTEFKVTVIENPKQTLKITAKSTPSLLKGNWNTSFTSTCDKVTSLGSNEYKFHFTAPINKIPDATFISNQNLTAVTFIPESVKTIGQEAFLECNNLKSVNFNEGLEEIGRSAFATNPSSSTGISEFTLPSTLKTIRSYAFKDCRAKTIVVPENVTTMDEYAFWDCGVATLIRLKCKTPPVSSTKTNTDGWYRQFLASSNTAKIYIPYSSLQAYKTSVYWKYYYEKDRFITY